MICPHDNTAMHEVRVESHYGLPVVLDQCPACGGIWFDRAELFRAKPGEAEKVELLDTVLLSAQSGVQPSRLLCPRDDSELVRFADRYFPESLLLARCPACGGIWLNRGDFVRYQTAREELKHSREKEAPDDKFAEDVKSILEMQRSEGSYETLANLGRFLSTPVDDMNSDAPDITENPAAEQTAVNVIFSILSLMLSTITGVRFF